MQSAHSLPIKALAQQCGVSARTITRHRDYIVAAALLIDGDYPILCTYLQTMRKEAEQYVLYLRIFERERPPRSRRTARFTL